MMMKKYAVAAAFAGSLLAAPAFAQDATSCTTMLSDFDAHLAANNIQATDERVTAATGTTTGGTDTTGAASGSTTTTTGSGSTTTDTQSGTTTGGTTSTQ
jgi:hypothetical protein